MIDMIEATRAIVAELLAGGEAVKATPDTRIARWREVTFPDGVRVRLRFAGIGRLELGVEGDALAPFDLATAVSAVRAAADAKRSAMAAEAAREARFDAASELLDRLRLRGTGMDVDVGTVGLVLRLRAPATPAQIEAMALAARECGILGP